CNHCLNKCKELSKKCPVCRTEIIELGLDIYPKSIEINLNINNQENKYNKMFRYLSRCCYMSNIIFLSCELIISLFLVMNEANVLSLLFSIVFIYITKY
ncbi:MAG: hypothetical protein KGD67_12730, partial [Candidatus Lokiarchaeota archaeon]|nr:hypothetical protein [Candidatus Lokiarchaeota archaeon]